MILPSPGVAERAVVVLVGDTDGSWAQGRDGGCRFGPAAVQKCIDPGRYLILMRHHHHAKARWKRSALAPVAVAS
jgi:hypothetical protein